jgi:hypothetical protein
MRHSRSTVMCWARPYCCSKTRQRPPMSLLGTTNLTPQVFVQELLKVPCRPVFALLMRAGFLFYFRFTELYSRSQGSLVWCGAKVPAIYTVTGVGNRQPPRRIWPRLGSASHVDSVLRMYILTPFYILLTVHYVMVLGKWPTWCTILYYVFIFIFNSLHVSSTSYSSSGETNFVNTTSDDCQKQKRKIITIRAQKSRSRLQILGLITVTGSCFHAGDPQPWNDL